MGRTASQEGPADGGSQPTVRGHINLALLLIAVTAALLAAVYSGWLVGLDTAVASAANPPSVVDDVFRFVAALWSPESSLVLGITGALVLLLMGAGRWAAAAVGFLLLVPVEVALKITLERPEMPHILKPWPGYAVVSFTMPDAVINGSPIRTGFICLLWALVLWRQGGVPARIAAAGAIAINFASVAVRVGGQYHWLSGEVAGNLLGCAFAVALAPFVSRAIEVRTRRAR